MKNATPLWSALAMALGFSGGVAIGGDVPTAPLYGDSAQSWAIHYYAASGGARLTVSSASNRIGVPRYVGSVLLELPTAVRTEIVALSPSTKFRAIYVNQQRAAVRLPDKTAPAKGTPTLTRGWIAQELTTLCKAHDGLCSPKEGTG